MVFDRCTFPEEVVSMNADGMAEEFVLRFDSTPEQVGSLTRGTVVGAGACHTMALKIP